MNLNKWVRQIHRWLSIAFTLTVIRLYADRHRQLHRHGTGKFPHLVGLLTAAPALPADVYRPVHVRIAVYGQVARRATRQRIR